MTTLNFQKNQAPSNQDQSKPPAPVAGTVITVDILDVDFSQLNPRKTGDKNYQEDYKNLKDSIKNSGLGSVLTITTNPQTEKYEMFNGGNTRLKILKELYHEYLEQEDKETADSLRYQQVLYQPYTTDIEVLVQHMAENEQRIGMTYIDKARAIFKIKALYLSENSLDEISNNKLVKYIHSLGWTNVNQRAMTELTFAYEKLDQIIPFALNSGMGKAKIQQLRIWLSNTLKYITWLIKEYQYDYSVEKAEDLYFETLKPHDDEFDPIDLNNFWQEYLFNLSTLLMKFNSELNLEHVQYEIKMVQEFGEVLETVPQEKLSQQLRDTATVDIKPYPTPRKTREAKKETGNNNQKTTSTQSSTPSFFSETDPSLAIGNTPVSSIGLSTSFDEFVVPYRNQAIKIISTLLEKYDFVNKLKIFISYGDLDNEFHGVTPFFEFNLSTEKDKNELIQVILSSEWADKLTALHFIHISLIYYENDILLDSLGLDETNTYKNLKSIWSEYSQSYTHYLGLCQTGLINRTGGQKQQVMDAYSLIRQYLDIIAICEQAQLDSIQREEGYE